MIKLNIKQKITSFLYKCIELVERIEYRNIDLDEDDISKKILEYYSVDNYEVLSDTGFVDISEVNITQPYKHYKLELENGYDLTCADNHIVFGKHFEELFVKDLKIGDIIKTDDGDTKVKSISRLNRKTSMGDLSIDHPNHRYYTNGILSHNTINAAILILYFSIFNNNKNVLIAANIKVTTNEIIEKIKSIYYYLPFWIKPGVTIWNKGEISFGDTKCRIMTSATTKTAAIGKSIDLLYLDEFAHVPNNISEDFYRSIFPTVSGIDNSKIIITSTPNGYNLFWKLLSGAEKPPGDKDKNRFASKRVYWYEVASRFVTYLRLSDYSLEKHNITKEQVYEWIKNIGFLEEEKDDKGNITQVGIKMIYSHETMEHEIHIPNKDEFIPQFIKREIEKKEWENPLSDFFRSFYYDTGDSLLDGNNEPLLDEEGNTRTKTIKLLEFCEVSSWKEDAIKDIGSVEAFNQEYDLQFLAGSKTLFDSNTMEKIKNRISEFKHIEIPKLSERTYIPYDELSWIKDRPDLFDIANVKDYHMAASIDIGEGLGGDYSVINFFRLVPKKIEEFPLNFKTVYDFFKLEQVGLYKCNTVSVSELAELCYILFFEVFDQDKMSVVLETNTYGGDFLNSMKNLFNGRNEYSSHIFYRYKHRVDAEKPKIGIKLRANKNLYVKDYQKRIRLGDVVVNNIDTLLEMTTFIKKESTRGYKYEADAGAHDDIVMTVVEVSTIFDNYKFHDLCNELMDKQTGEFKRLVEELIKEAPNIEAMDYSVLFNAKAKVIPPVNKMPGHGYPDKGNNPYLNPGLGTSAPNPYIDNEMWNKLTGNR